MSGVEVVEGRPGRNGNDWQECAKKSGWSEHIRAILAGTLKIVKAITGGTAVFVHCSDGWDRTAQLTSLAAICLDSYYRSTKGLQALIEREWFQAGHKFARRYYT